MPFVSVTSGRIALAGAWAMIGDGERFSRECELLGRGLCGVAALGATLATTGGFVRGLGDAMLRLALGMSG
jgi:hypothetical protein